MRIAVALGLACVAFAAAPAHAKETAAVAKANALLAEADKAIKATSWDKAAQSVAEAVALAQKEKDLRLEQRGADVLEDLLDEMGESGGGDPRNALVTVMRALDPARHGALVSAHALATELVLRAVERGDAVHVAAAEAVLATFAATPQSGKGAAAMAKLAQGVKAARGADTKTARTVVEAVLPLVKQGRWLRVNLAAHLEWMLLQVAAGDLTGAEKTMRDAAGYLALKEDQDRANVWAAAVRARLAKAPPEAQSAFDRAVERYVTNVGVGGAGRRGGDAEAGPDDQSPLGKAWAALPAAKPFATVKRTGAGYEITAAHDKQLAFTQKPEPGQVSWSQDGLTLSFADGAVAVDSIDLLGTRGGPGTRPLPSAARGWYLLAPGETFGVTKAGLVVVN